MCGQMKIHRPISPSARTVFLQSICCLTGLPIIPAQVSGRVHIHFLRIRFAGLLKSVSFSTRLHMWFKTTVLHNAAVVKCVNVCLKIILDTGFFSDIKLQFSGLQVHLIWILLTLIFFGGIYLHGGLCQYNQHWRKMMTSKSTESRIHPESSNVCEFFHTELSCVSLNMQAI
jgi:hypothetical protein